MHRIHVRSTVWAALVVSGFMIIVGELGADSIGVPTPLHVAWHLLVQWRKTH